MTQRKGTSGTRGTGRYLSDGGYYGTRTSAGSRRSRSVPSEECEHDDLMYPEDYDRRAARRDGWATPVWNGRF